MVQVRPATLQPPTSLPAQPGRTATNGWISYPDWLGYEGIKQHKDMLSFAVARAVARKLKLKSYKEWETWSSSGQRPSNIPSHPSQVYRDDGWISIPNWLGYGSAAGARTASQSSSSSSASTAPKKTKKRKRRRPAAPHPDSPPPPPPASHPKRRIKTEEPHPSGTSGNPTSTADDPPLRKIKKEEEEGAC